MIVSAGSCLRALSVAILPKILEEGSGTGRRATGTTAELVSRLEAAFEKFRGSVDPVSSRLLYTDETYALHERTLDNAHNHQYTGKDMQPLRDGSE